MIESTLKTKKNKMPLRRKDTKVHKELIFNDLIFVLLCAFVPLWPKKYFMEGTHDSIKNRG